MKRIVKQVIGIDVAQAELVVCVGRTDENGEPDMYAHKTFANTKKGFGILVAWVRKQTDATAPVWYVMEATGVYHESLAYFLDEQQVNVSIILPNKIYSFARSLDTKTVTDKTASEAITQFGLSRKLDAWHRPNALYKKLRQLSRERGQLVDERTALKNQMHAEQAEAEPCKESVTRTKKRIALLDKQEKEIMKQVKALIKTDAEVMRVVDLMCTLPGVGLITAVSVISETNGFDLIRNKRQLTSYAGLDVKEKQSGTSVKGKPSISKRGNKFLRKAMHFPALTAIRVDPRYGAIFTRLFKKHGIRMKAVVAVQRKLLELMYTMYKTNKEYESEYLTKDKNVEKVEAEATRVTKNLRNNQLVDCPPKQAGKSRLHVHTKI